MKIESYTYPKSSFLSIEKDMGIIISEILRNDRIKKLLYYTTKDCLKRPKLKDNETLELIQNNIKRVPKLYTDKEALNYLMISFDNFSPNAENPQFRDNVIMFDIICHYDQWELDDFKLRPYRIAAEIDMMFNNKHLTGIGTLQFAGMSRITLTEEFSGLCMMFLAIHGEEDKKNMPKQEDQQEFEEFFDQMYNDKH